ncbi:phage integrase family protein [Gloeobacter kilaueensis JS1]|uniref:Phage integrase family protein n=2 Tax=Gloeobacter TaxID=33071 RepID=U5QI02_GLOK1|nr:phage integrase family protein [Gloeobacter kilaueensis JS1]
MSEVAEKVCLAILAANKRLKERGSGVQISLVGGYLYLRATLPPLPASAKKLPFQQRIPLHLRASVAGIAVAERKARLVGEQLENGVFSWDEYKPSSPPAEKQSPPLTTLREVIARMEEDYFQRRPREPGPLATWQASYRAAFIQLDQDAPFTVELLHQAILSKPAGTRAREKFCFAMGKLAEFAKPELNFDIKALKGTHTAKQVLPRNLPEDSEIEAWREKIPNPGWQCIYSAIAVFG